jgi:uncharacterized OB-fold protein
MHEVVEQPALVAPTPPMNTDTEAFWAATTKGRLLITRCDNCGEAIWYPRPICPFCHSQATHWEESEGRGRLYSFTVVRRGSGAFASATPYVLAYVELAEGPRMMTNVVDCDPETLNIGDELEVVFHQSEGGPALPRFRPASR